MIFLGVFLHLDFDCAAGGAHVESRWSDSGQLPVLSSRQGPQQKLPDIAQRFVSLCVAHPKHGGEVGQDTCLNKCANILNSVVNYNVTWQYIVFSHLLPLSHNLQTVCHKNIFFVNMYLEILPICKLV